ncbi:MAG: dTDP-4-dehydrorhamnose reductase [Mariprofundales bacterium]
MKVLITGAGGQLSTALARLGGAHQLLALAHDQLDITDGAAVMQCVAAFASDVVVNGAAYTAVDSAESDRDRVFAVNRDGPKHLAIACEKQGIPLIHISTDYLFDGSKAGAYLETDPVAPLGVYGKSKRAGELAVQQHCSRHLILRTSWVFSAHGNNFVKTMLRLAAERTELDIVADQQGCPTSAAELARAIYAVLDGGLNREHYGIYHFCQPEPTNWHGFAQAIFAEARRQGMALAIASVKAIATADYPTPAARPANSVMDCARFEAAFSFKIRPWSGSLADVIGEMLAVEHPLE